MIKVTSLRSSLLIVIAWLILVSGCARMPDIPVTTLKPKTSSELREYLLTHKAVLDQFRSRGPFAVAIQNDRELRLSAKERFSADLYLASPAEKAPLVVFMHGYDSAKEDHGYQAMHLASWGMHSLVLQLPKHGPWSSNGRTLARIVNFIHLSPGVIDSRIDPNKIILVGHSFGGYAVTVAIAEGAATTGGILLDPAIPGNSLPKFMQKINKPVMLLGADEEVSPVRYRDYFFRYIPRGIAEVSIRDAAHEDATYPLDSSLQNSGIDPLTTEELQITFVSILTSAAFSLSSTGTLDYAWASLGDYLKNDKLFNAKKK
jgi:pimeloyl-ACP methyl ester carboxylesterase